MVHICGTGVVRHQTRHRPNGADETGGERLYSYVDVKNATAAESFAANAGFVVGRDGILVVDTLISAKEARRFIGDIRKVSDKPIRYVVDTHYHLDHAFGNSNSPGWAQRSSPRRTTGRTWRPGRSQPQERRELRAHRKGYGRDGDHPADSHLHRPADHRPGRGNRGVDLRRYLPARRASSSISPARKILFTGDVLFTDFHPFMADGDIAGWVKTLDSSLALDVTTMIPGHGPISGKKDIAEMKGYSPFDRKARQLAAKSNDVDFIAAELKKVLPARSLGEWMIAYNLKMKYLPAK